MPGKNSISRKIDVPPSFSGGDASGQILADAAPLVARSIATPTNVVLTSALERSAVTPTASILATWDAVIGPVVEQYAVQVGEQSNFSDAETYHAPFDLLTLTVVARKTGTLYYVRVAAVSGSEQSAWSDSVSTTTLSDTTAPAAPTGAAYDWSGPNLLLTWINPTSANFKDVQIDIYASNGGALLHTFYSAIAHFTCLATQNLADTAGVGDPSLYVVLTSRSVANIPCVTPVSLSPVNAAPSAPTVAATVNLSQALATVTSTPPLDLDVYEFVWKNSVPATVRTTLSQGATDIYQATASDTYSVVVRVRDIFGQYSPTTTVSALVVDALTIADLRSDSSYSDSISTDFSSAPNKTVLKDDASGAGISYAASASAWRWTKVAYPLTDRFRRISLVLGTGAANLYVGLSADDVTYTWYSGSLTGFVLALVASEAAAQTAAPLFSALPGGYAELPATIEARFVKIGHRNTGSGYRLDEAYGQRLVIADVIKVGQLSAIAADMGSIIAGTITGALIRSAASGARMQFTSSAFEGYTASAQFLTANPTDGISLTLDTVTSNQRSYTFTGSVGVGQIGLFGAEDAGTNFVELHAGVVPGKSTLVQLDAVGDAVASIAFSAATAGGNVDMELVSNDAGGGSQLVNIYNNTNILAGLYVGSAPAGAAPAIGKIKATGYTAGGVFFQGASSLITQDNSNLFFDDTNNRLGIGNAAPATTLHVTGTARATAGLTLDFVTAGSVLFGGASGVVSQDNSNLFWDDTANNLYIGANTQGNGIGRVVVKGADSSNTAGPHMEFLTAADAYPIIQVLSYVHDNNYLSFDAYLNSSGVWKSSYATSNFQLRKHSDEFGIWYGGPIAQGSTVTWAKSLIANISGQIGIGNSPTVPMDVYGADAGTTNDLVALALHHNTSGTSAAGFGVQMEFFLDSATVANRLAGGIAAVVVSPTDGSRTNRLVWYATDAAANREGLRIEASGSAAKLGALGAAAVIRQSVAAAITDTADLTYSANEVTMLGNLKTLANDLRTALISLGFVS